MTELKVTSKKYNDKDELLVEDKPLFDIAEKAIKADKDVISQIKVEYNEEDDITIFNFPLNILVLSIRLNTHDIYFAGAHAVGDSGQEAEGYVSDEIYAGEDENYITFLGDLSEQVINGLVYINYNKDVDPAILSNSYYLFYPKKAGTKLYLHTIRDVNEVGFEIISINANPLNFEELNTYDKVYNYIEDSVDIISVKSGMESVVFDSTNHVFAYIVLDNGVLTSSLIDDWVVTTSVDTVTEL